MGRRTAATGVSAPAGGLSSGMHPPFSFPSCGKENGPCTVQKKRPLGRAPVQWPSARRGSAYRCKRRFGLAFGHAILFCKFVTAVPWRMVLLRRGGRRTASAPLFAAAGRPARELVQRADEGIRPYGDTAGPARRGRPVCRPLQERQPQRRGRYPHPPGSISPYDHPGSA